MYFSRFTKEERRDYLRKAHNFKCTCEACVGDQFPPLCDLLIKNTDLFGSITEFDKNLNTLTHKQLRDKYKYYMKVLRKNHAQFPSDELTRIQDHAFKILQHTSRPAYTFF